MAMVLAAARDGTKPLPLVLLFRYIYNPAALTASKGAQNPVLRRLYRMLNMIVANPVVIIMAAPGRAKALSFFDRNKYRTAKIASPLFHLIALFRRPGRLYGVQ